MKVCKVRQGDVIAKRQEKVMEWYLIQEGSVSQRFGFAEIVLPRNAMIGMLENGRFMCDYVAREDTTLIVIECKDSEDLQVILAEHADYRAVFLRAALEQKYRSIHLYLKLQEKARLLHSFAENSYNDYKMYCEEFFVKEQPFTRMESFESLSLQHKADIWEINSCRRLTEEYMKEYIRLMIKDDALCVGAIMEASAQVRRVTQGIGEMVNYLLYNRDVIWSDSYNDLFHLFIDLVVKLSKQQKNITKIRQEMEGGYTIMQQLGVYSRPQLEKCKKSYQNYDFESISQGRITITKEDCVRHIMTYAGYEDTAILQMKQCLDTYKNLSDPQSTDSDAYAIRKKIFHSFYEIYEKVFFKSVTETQKLSPILNLFLHFGFMDVELLGEENTNAISNMLEHLEIFQSENVYTIYTWLLAVYKGEKEPCRNEFDLNYQGYLLEQRKHGEITEEQMAVMKNDNWQKTAYEIHNMFQSVHRLTYGRPTSFIPILQKNDFINTVEKMAVTADVIEESINKIRELDYSILYREVMFRDAAHGIEQEWIMKEVLPDVILMPAAGSKGVMWQETSSAKTDTPARFFFPMFTAVDLDEQMLEVCGRYRWEICRRIQGVYWNDIREKSLTAEYFDYLQFYRKNHDLSAENKEKLKTALQKARNSYREVFVKDYVSWMKYESKGSYRLNKVARNLLVTYCPFSKEIRNSLKSNPSFVNAFGKLEATNGKKMHRLISMYDKYEEMGGVITQELKENMQFFMM